MALSDEKVINEYLNKERSGITVNKEFLFMPVRITGMDKTTRINQKKSLENIRNKFPNVGGETWEEVLKYCEDKDLPIKGCFEECIVDRPKEEFSNLDLYNGLPILKDHPADRQMLKYDNIKDNPIIGTIVKPYFKGEEIWGIAKIYDLTLLDELEKLQSTSPAVTSILDIPENNGIIKESPIHFNHLAFVNKGHWDQVSDKAYDSDGLVLNIDKEAEDMSLKEDVEKLKSTEKKEGEKFEELAESHGNLDKENPLTDGDENKLDKEQNMVEKIGEEIKDSDEEIKDSDEEIKDSDEEIKDSDEEIKDSDEEIKDSDEEVEVESSEIRDEEENQLDEERYRLINHFRDAKERSHPSIGVKMPYIGKRENPSAVLSRILKLNSHLFNPKYDRSLDNKFNIHNFALQIDAFNDLLSNIEIETEKAYKRDGRNRTGFVPTAKDYIQIDKNF